MAPPRWFPATALIALSLIALPSSAQGDVPLRVPANRRPVAATAADANSPAEAQNAAIAQLRDDLAALTTALHAAEAELVTINTRLASTNATVSTLTTENAQLKTQVHLLDTYRGESSFRLVALEGIAHQYQSHRHLLQGLGLLGAVAFPAAARPMGIGQSSFVTVTGGMTTVRISDPITGP
jgi:septal ring factor EnvC (AmiA/AmiB activator)